MTCVHLEGNIIYDRVDQVYVYFCHMEFEPSGSAVTPNPHEPQKLKWLQGQQLLPIPRATKIKMESSVKKKNVSHGMDKIIYGAVFPCTRKKKGCFVVLRRNPSGD